jgi:hypothetical protein
MKINSSFEFEYRKSRTIKTDTNDGLVEPSASSTSQTKPNLDTKCFVSSLSYSVSLCSLGTSEFFPEGFRLYSDSLLSLLDHGSSENFSRGS